jgi:diacylglycerol kinase family enzyme
MSPLVSRLPADARDVFISVNPAAGARSRGAVVDDLAARLAAAGFQVTRLENIDELAQAAQQGLAAGTLRAVVAGGGDGTVRLIAGRTPPGTPILILPLGTENLLAKHLEIAASPQQLCQLATDGWTVRLDAGEANGRLFSLMAGCGFDAEVVRRVHGQRRGHIHHLSYAKPILDAIRNYDYPELRVYYRKGGQTPDCGTAGNGLPAGFTDQITARWVFVVNLPRYAGGLSFAPEASGADGLLDVCTFKEGSLWNGLLYLGSMMLGQHRGMQDFTAIRTDCLRIEAAGEVPFQLDGDAGGALPLDVRTLPGRLTLLVAPQWAERQGFVVTQQ